MRLVLTLLTLVLAATSAQAQQTCRAADITSDGQVSAPDFTALSVCYGHPVTAPLPVGDYVGISPSTLQNPDQNSITRDQECRDNFGPDAHWCTTLEMSQIPDVLAIPEALRVQSRYASHPRSMAGWIG